MLEPPPHILLVTFPVQGHINPALQFAKRLLRIGVRVTFVTSLSAKRRMLKTSFPNNFCFATFSDGYDNGLNPEDDPTTYLSEMKRCGSQTLSDLILSNANQGNPFTCLIYTLLLPWVAEVARAHHIPYSLLWIQPATVLDIYYYYFNGYGDLFCNFIDPSYVLKLPNGLPLLATRDLPSFLVPSQPYTYVLTCFEEQLRVLSEESEPKILVNTFDALELEALKSIENFEMIAIGPLVPSAFLDGKDPSDTSFGGDLFQSSKDDYLQWLDSKPEGSVVYVSFGSICALSKKQMEEIGDGLLSSSHPFLWVIREDLNCNKDQEMICKEELKEKGKIVGWCRQLEVLNHPAIGCFVTHCGWNSSLESLVSGVPVVAFPQWTDQGTNAKLIEEQWKIGVRVLGNQEGFVDCEEIVRCLNLVMGGGEKAQEIKNNSKKWKDLARVAVQDGGSSDVNLKAFVDEIVARL